MDNSYLYKAKRIDNGEWIEGYYVKCRNHYYILPTYNEQGFDERYTEWAEIDAFTLCQCTGTKDKKGVLIWENDSCLITRTAICVSVRIIYKDACFWAKDEPHNTLIRLCDLKLNGYEIEVVTAIWKF